jgi:thymidylate kinase
MREMKDNRITVIEGPRLAGKSRIVQYLQKLYSDGSHQHGLYPIPEVDWLFKHVVKDVAFNYIKEFGFIENPRELESFVTGKEMALTQRINSHEKSVLVDRYLITAAVYSHVFRKFPTSVGETYLQEMNSIIDKDFANLKRRLRFFVIIPDIDRALEEGLTGREGKDGLEDNKALLQTQINLYTKYALMMEKMGFKVKIRDSYHLDPDVSRHIFEDLRDE